MVDLTFTPHIEILSAEDVPRRRHWSDADKIRLDLLPFESANLG
jgi:transposase